MQTQQESEISSAPDRAPRIFYGWYIVGAGTILGFLNLTIFMVGPGVFINDIREEMGWSMTAISFGFSLKQFEHGLLAPISGYLIDRLGPRLVATVGIIIMSLGLLLFAVMTSLWVFYVAATIIAIGQGTGSMLAFSTAVMHWFRRKRGQASGILAMGRAWGYIGVLGLTWLLVNFGWRWAAAIAAIIFCVFSLPLAQVIRHRPEPYGYLPDGDHLPTITKDENVPHVSTDEADSYSVKEALRSVAFWMVLFANALYGFCNNINLVHLIPALRVAGFSATGAGTLVAVFGGIQVIGRLTAGWLGDKIGRHRLLMASFVLLSLGWLFLANISQDRFWVTALYLLTYTTGQSAHTVTAQTVVADFFGTRRYATIRGLMSSLSLVGAIIGPVFAGIMFDAFGNYHLTFITLAIVISLGTPAIFLAGKPTLTGATVQIPDTRINR